MPLKMQQKHPENPTAAASSSSESEEEHETPSLLKKPDEEASSSEEAEEEGDEEAEEASSSEEGDEEGDEEEVAQSVAQATANSPCESDSGSDSDYAPPPLSPNPKSKPNPESQIQASPSCTPAKSAAKRPAEESGDPKPAKKMKGVVVGSEQEKSLKPFQKVWSDEDEITIVKALAEFMSRTGNDPTKYADGFYDSVKKSLLKADTNGLQLKEKVRRLKMKFQTHVGKGKNGEDPNFTKPHDRNVFELCKTVWGKKGANEADGKPKSNPKKSKPSPEPESDMQVDTADSSLLLREMLRVSGPSGPSEDVVKEGLALIGASKREELEGKWKKLQVAELEQFVALFVERTELIKEQYRLVLEALKSSNN